MNPTSIKYHSSLAGYFQSIPLYLNVPTQKKPNTRKLIEQPKQQTRRKRWNEVSDTLHNLDVMEPNSNTQMINNRK